MKKKPLVSIVIPVYNVASYLEQCLDSVENQIYKNIQVIMVNDGSTDNSLEICSKYEKKGWLLINQKNGGLSCARNTGLSHATGEYIVFVDSDDWIDQDFIKNLLEVAVDTGADIVESGIRWQYPDREYEEVVEKKYILSKQDALSAYLLQTMPIHSAVWCKIYKRDIFEENSLKFEVGKLHEDGFFTYRAMYASPSYVVIPYVGYNYRQNRDGSIMSSQIKPQNILDVTEMMEERILFFKEKKEILLAEQAEAYYYRTTLTNYNTSISVMENKELAENLKTKLMKDKKIILKNKWLGIKKIKFIMYFYFPHIYAIKYL